MKILIADDEKEIRKILKLLLEGRGHEILEAEDGEMLRIKLKCEGEDVLLTDYQSCGKHWNNMNAKVSVWLNAK